MTITYMAPFWGILLVLGLWFSRKVKTVDDYLLSGRNVGKISAALSIAASWIWAPAIFIASQKAYQQGLAGVFWFTVPNILSLVFFGFLAQRIRTLFPQGYTLPQYMGQRYSSRVKKIYLLQFLVLQVCSFAVQLLAGGALISIVSGISFNVAVILFAIVAISYSLLGGLRASMGTDVLQMLIMLGMISLLIPFALKNQTSGLDSIIAGFKGISGIGNNIFDPWIVYSFGIPVTIGLLAGPIGDQQHWQRAFSIKKDKDVIPSFLIGAFIFAIVPISLSILGFLAVGSDVSISNPQMVGVEFIKSTLPNWCLGAFLIIAFAALTSTLDSILSAASSLVVVDILGLKEATVFRARMSMIILTIVGTSIALIPGLTILHLFLVYGILRASTMLPTLWTLFRKDQPEGGIFWSVLLSLLFCGPTFAVARLMGYTHLSIAATLGVIGLYREYGQNRLRRNLIHPTVCNFCTPWVF